MNVSTPEKAFQVLGRQDLLQKHASAGEDYPFTSRNATLYSFVTAHVKEASEEVLQKCTEYARFWNITEECEEAVRKIAAYTPPQLKDSDYALAQGGVRKFASYDHDSTCEASVAFIDQRAKMPLAWRKEAAARLLARAERYGVYLPEYVEAGLHKSAGLGYPSVESLEEALVSRLNSCKDDELCEKLAQVIEPMIDDQQLRYDEEQVKIAVEALEVFDAGMGLTEHYGQGIDLPESIIETTTADLAKVAGVKLAVELINGRTVELDKLSKEALAAVDPALAKMAQDELAQVLPTLPKGDADLLARLL